MIEIERIDRVEKVQIAKTEKNPLSAQVYTLIKNSQVLKSHKEFHLACNLLRQASSMQTHPMILKELTQNLVQLEKWNEAVRVCQQWNQIETTFEAVYFRAQIEYQLNQDDKSLQSYFEALSIVDDAKPELFDVFKNMGNLFVRKADFESAEEFYNKAYAINASSDTLLVNYGILEMQRGDLNKAKDRFRSAVQINSRNDKAWVGLSMVHFDFGDEELGIANLKKAIDLELGNKTALQLAVQKMTQKSHCEYLIEVLSQYLCDFDFDDSISCQLIQKFYESGQIDLAYLESQRLILWNPEKDDFFKLNQHLEVQLHQKSLSA